MLKNYFRIAGKNLYHAKGNFFINILGLSVGIAASLIIFLFVTHEMNCDVFHENVENVYRVAYKIERESGSAYIGTTPPPLAPVIVETIPRVTRAARLRYARTCIVKYNHKQFYEDYVFYADPAILEILTLPFASGIPDTALDKPNSVVITGETATKYFGNLDPIDKTITTAGVNLKVTGVLKPIAEKSHLKFDFLVSFATFEVPKGFEVTLDSWAWNSFYTYLLLKPNVNPKVVESEVTRLLTHHRKPGSNTKIRVSAYLQPLKDIYFETDVTEFYGVMVYGNKHMLYILLAIAAVILFFTWFNFTRLFTIAFTVNLCGPGRIHETDIRKQVLFESVLAALIGLVLALVWVFLLHPFSKTLFVDIPGFNLQSHFFIFLPFLLFSLVIGLTTGSYCAATAAATSPAKKSKSGCLSAPLGKFSGKVVVFLQFTAAIALVSTALITSRQMNFIDEKDLGFDKNEVIVLDVPGSFLKENYEIVKRELKKIPGVIDVCASGEMLDGRYGTHQVVPGGEGTGNSKRQGIRMAVCGVYPDYFKTLGMNIVKGKDFSGNMNKPMKAFVINETAANMLGWDNPIGKKVRIIPYPEGGEIIGVVENFHFASLHEKIKPLILSIPASEIGKVFLKVNERNIPNVLETLENKWDQITRRYPFSSTRLAEHIDELYLSGHQFLLRLQALSILAVFIALAGLVGLFSGLNPNSTNEKENIRSLLIQSLIALSVSDLTAFVMVNHWMGKWLCNFAYSIGIDLKIFVFVGLLSVASVMAVFLFKKFFATIQSKYRIYK